MKKFIEINQLHYITKQKYVAALFDERSQQTVTEEIVIKKIIPIDNIKTVFCEEPTQLLIQDEREGLIYIKVKDSYEDIKNKLRDVLC